jgi:hypothetical protein
MLTSCRSAASWTKHETACRTANQHLQHIHRRGTSSCCKHVLCMHTGLCTQQAPSCCPAVAARYAMPQGGPTMQHQHHALSSSIALMLSVRENKTTQPNASLGGAVQHTALVHAHHTAACHACRAGCHAQDCAAWPFTHAEANQERGTLEHAPAQMLSQRTHTGCVHNAGRRYLLGPANTTPATLAGRREVGASTAQGAQRWAGRDSLPYKKHNNRYAVLLLPWVHGDNTPHQPCPVPSGL